MCRPVCKCRTNNGGRQKQNGEEWGEGEIEEDEGRESCMDLSLSFLGAGTAFILKYRLNGGVRLRYMAVDVLKMQFSRRCQISYNSAVCVCVRARSRAYACTYSTVCHAEVSSFLFFADLFPPPCLFTFRGRLDPLSSPSMGVLCLRVIHI